MKLSRKSHGGKNVPPPTSGWKPGELNLRIREVAATENNMRTQKWVQFAQVLSVLVALASTVVALYTARQSSAAANAAAQSSAQQADEAELTSAISSLDEGNSSARATRLILAARDVQRILSLPPSTQQARRDAYSDYSTLLDALSIYLRSHGVKSTRASGIGYGVPPTPGIDVTEAVADIKILIGEKRAVKSLNRYLLPSVDLSGDELSGQLLPQANFSWISGSFAGVDLRGAVLFGSDFHDADLTGAYLQCANLEGANFRNADLANADLRGAEVSGADFRGAFLAGAKTGDLRGKAKGLPQGSPFISHRTVYGLCLAHFQDRQNTKR